MFALEQIVASNDAAQAKFDSNVGPDFDVANHGSIFLLQPLTKAGHDWVNENILVEGNEVQTFGGAIAVEHRCIGDIVDGIRGDGLEVQ